MSRAPCFKKPIDKTNKIPFGQRKSNGKFGKTNNGDFGKTSKGDFGKKPSKGDFGKTKHTLISKSILTSKPMATRSQSDKNKITTLEQKFLDWLHEEEQLLRYPCFVCGEINHRDPIEWHHIKKYSSDKKNHKKLLPLCGAKHHRLGKVMSPHGAAKNFRAKYSQAKQNKFAKEIWDTFRNSIVQ